MKTQPDSAKTKNATKDVPEVIEIQTFKGSPDGEATNTLKETSHSSSIDTEIKPGGSQETQPTSARSGAEAETMPKTPPTLSSGLSTDLGSPQQHKLSTISTVFHPLDRVIYTQPSKIPYKTVGTVEKQPTTYVVLSVISAFINPLCGALAIWQSWSSSDAYLKADMEGARIKGSRARMFAILGILLSGVVAVTFYFFWTKAYEDTSEI